MRQRFAWIVGLIAVAAAGSVVTLSLNLGQTPAPRPDPPATLPASVANAPPLSPNNTPPSIAPVKPVTFLSQPQHDLNKMPPFTRQVHISAVRGADWLQRIQNPATGRFMYGWI